MKIPQDLPSFPVPCDYPSETREQYDARVADYMKLKREHEAWILAQSGVSAMELLEMLEEALSSVESDEINSGSDSDLSVAMRALINKARGRS